MTQEQVDAKIVEMKEKLAADRKRHSVDMLNAKPKVRMALSVATDCHIDQKRKYTGAPYIDHPIEVANILIQHKVVDERTLCVALLHDVMEDCGVSFDWLRNKFGEQIALDVKALTNPPKQGGDRAARKKTATANVIARGATPIMVKLADITSNIRDVALYDSRFATLYLEEKKEAISAFNWSSVGKSNEIVRTLCNTAYSTYSEALNQLALTVLAEENERVADEAQSKAEIEQILYEQTMDEMADLALF